MEIKTGDNLISKTPEKTYQPRSPSLKHEFYISAAIFIASLVYYLSYASYGFSEGDWGGIVVAAERFLQGDVFYRDFTTVYAPSPGIYLYTALAFKLFGVNLLSATIAWSIIRPFNCLLIYLLGLKFLPRRTALLLPLILWFAPGMVHKSFLVFFELLSLILLVRLSSTDSKGFYFLLGIVTGIFLIFRIDLFGIFVITLFLVELLKIIERRKKTTVKLLIPMSFKKLSFFSVGAILSVAPFALYLLINSAMTDAISQTLNFMSKTSLTPIPSIKQIFSWSKWDFVNYAVLFIPFAIYSLFLGVIFFNIKNNKFTDEEKKLSILVVYGLLFLHQITRSPWIGGLFQILPLILIVDMYLLSNYNINMVSGHLKKLRRIYPATLLTANSVLLFIMIVSLTMSDIYTNNSIFIRYTNTTLLSVPRVKVYTTYKLADEFNKVRSIIETETEKEDYIFFIQHHPMYYFVTGRKNPTRYYFIEGYMDSDKKQLEVIKNLSDKKVKLIILRANYPYTPHAPIVIGYLNKHYLIKEKVGNKIIYIRKDMVNASKSL